MLCLLTAASICLRCARGARWEPVRPTGGRAPSPRAQRRAKVGATCARGTTKQKPPAPRRSRGAGGARPRRGRAGRKPRREGQTRSTANRDRGHGAGARIKEHLGPRAGIRFQRMIKARRGHLRRCAPRHRANPQLCRAAGNSPGARDGRQRGKHGGGLPECLEGNSEPQGQTDARANGGSSKPNDPQRSRHTGDYKARDGGEPTNRRGEADTNRFNETKRGGRILGAPAAAGATKRASNARRPAFIQQRRV